MAQTTEQTETRQGNGNRGGDHGTRKTVVRAAAIAAASGATALAAKKAFSGSSGGSSGDKRSGSGSDESVITSMATSAWDSARGTLVPMIEDAAGQAGEYLAQNGPDIVTETIIPNFIEGFQRGSKSDSSD